MIELYAHILDTGLTAADKEGSGNAELEQQLRRRKLSSTAGTTTLKAPLSDVQCTV